MFVDAVCVVPLSARRIEDFWYAQCRRIVSNAINGIYDEVYELENVERVEEFLRCTSLTQADIRSWENEYVKNSEFWNMIARVRNAIYTCRRGRLRNHLLERIDSFICEYGFDFFEILFQVEFDEYQEWSPLNPYFREE